MNPWGLNVVLVFGGREGLLERLVSMHVFLHVSCPSRTELHAALVHRLQEYEPFVQIVTDKFGPGFRCRLCGKTYSSSALSPIRRHLGQFHAGATYQGIPVPVKAEAKVRQPWLSGSRRVWLRFKLGMSCRNLHHTHTHTHTHTRTYKYPVDNDRVTDPIQILECFGGTAEEMFL